MNLKQGNLDKQIAAGALAPETVLAVVRQVLAALSPLHAEGQMHGGINPASIRVGPSGKITLGEPANAEVSTETIGRSTAKPTTSAKYFAPEQLKSDFGPVGPATDIYCLGFTAMEMLLGPDFSDLFAGVGPDDIDVEIAWMRWHSSPGETLGPASSLVHGLPANLAAALDRMLKKRVQDRYPDAQAALQDIDAPTAAPKPRKKARKADTRQQEAPPTWQSAPPSPPTPLRPKRSAAAPILAGLLAIVLVAAGGYVFWPFKSDKVAVTIASLPPHAKVFLNDAPMKKGTDAVYDLAPGDYRLRLELDDYEPFEAKIGVAENRRIHKVTLTKLTTSISPKDVGPIAKNKEPDQEPKRITPKTVVAEIVTQPPGAAVTINDVLQEGKTNGRFTVPDGAFTLKLELPGYKTQVRRMASVDELKGTLALERARRTIMLASNPPGAEVYINDQLQDKKTDGIFEVDDGQVTLKFAHKGVPPVVRKVNPDQLDKSLEVVFERTVKVQSVPPGATIYVDGRKVADKTPAIVNLTPGKYQMKAELPGYNSEQKVIEVAGSELFQDASLTLHALATERHALLVGVRKPVDSLPSFVHAETDVEAIRQALEIGGFKTDKIAVLSQTRGKDKAAQAPSAANIKQGLQALLASNPSDIIVVALVGHVIETPGRAFYCPSGAELPNPGTLISFDEIYQALAAAPAQKKLLILDCWRKDWQADRPARPRLWDKAPPAGVTILYACAKGQTGFEHPSRWHGAFNDVLVQGLLGDGASSHVTSPALGEYCRRNLAKLMGETFRTVAQTPELAAASGEAWPIVAPGNLTTDYLLGCDQLERKNYDRALEAFTQAEAKLPGLVDLYLRRADACYDKRQFAEASADCRRALKLDPACAAAYANLAESQAVADFPLAERNANKAIELDKECALAFDARGAIYNTNKQFDLAVKDISEAIRLQKGLYVYYHHRAFVERTQKQLDKALADLNAAIERNDQKAFLFAERAEILSQKMNTKQAIEDYTEAINRDNTNAKWWHARGFLRFKVNDFNNAIVDFKNATALKADYKQAWLNLGYTYQANKMLPLAAEALEMAVQIDPRYENAHRLLYEVYRDLKEDQKAKMHLQKANELKKGG